MKRSGSCVGAGIIDAREVSLELAAAAKAIVKAPIGVITGEREVVEFTIRPGAAYPYDNDFAVRLQNDRVRRGRAVAEAGNNTTIAGERLVAAAVLD